MTGGRMPARGRPVLGCAAVARIDQTARAGMAAPGLPTA